MSDLLYTRCPYCRTTFRIMEQQLSVREGQVRCGQCRKVFNARGHLVTLSPSPLLARPEYELDEGYDPLKGPQTMTLRRTIAADSAESEAVASPAPVVAGEAGPPASDAAGQDAPQSPEDDVDGEHERVAAASFAWERPARPRRSRWSTVLYGICIPLLLFALAGQATHYLRSYVAAHVPALKPALRAYCKRVACQLEPLREAAALTIESSDLQADPAHKGLIILSLALRNRASYALAFPNLELALTDLQSQVVVRRVFTPEDYLRDRMVIASGLAAGEERPLKLFLDASAVSADGYKVERFYR
jgi:predicted Zn finger-like uncharacterized protein